MPELGESRSPQSADSALPAFSLSVALFMVAYAILVLADVFVRRSPGGVLARLLALLLRARSALPLLTWACLLLFWHWDTWVEFRFVSVGMTVQALLLLSPYLVYEGLAVLGEVMLRGRVGPAADPARATLFVAPLLFLLTALFDLANAIEPLRILFQELSIARYALGLLGFVLIFLVFPRWFALVYGATPLEPPWLREELLQVAKKGRARVHRVLEVPTRGRYLNATLVGPFAATRSVFFTDLMLARFGVDELRAVFAHELGHVRGRHVFRSLTCFVVLPLLAAELGMRSFGSEGEWAWAAWLLASFAVLALPFFWFRRRFEHEADLHGATLLGGAAGMIAALSSVRRLAPSLAGRGSLFHPSTDRRIEVLRSFEAADRADDSAAANSELRAWARRGSVAQGLLFFLLGFVVMAFVSHAVTEFEDDLPGYYLARGDGREAYAAFERRTSMDATRRAEGLDAAMRVRLISYGDATLDRGLLAQRARSRGQRAARDEDWEAVRGWFGLVLRLGGDDPLVASVWRFLEAVDRGDGGTAQREAAWIRALSVPEELRRPIGRLLMLDGA